MWGPTWGYGLRGVWSMRGGARGQEVDFARKWLDTPRSWSQRGSDKRACGLRLTHECTALSQDIAPGLRHRSTHLLRHPDSHCPSPWESHLHVWDRFYHNGTALSHEETQTVWGKLLPETSEFYLVVACTGFSFKTLALKFVCTLLEQNLGIKTFQQFWLFWVDYVVLFTTVPECGFV